ncbi:glutamate-ammonia-ligase adenylyltransferase [Vibrio sp. JCM 18905]|nr:glutamate-ammonia-ligase adenylyltransferase [Vibrio sp. JCM 18905]
MQLPSPLISIAESAVQNAQEAGYFPPLWPDEIAQQFRYVAA